MPLGTPTGPVEMPGPAGPTPATLQPDLIHQQQFDPQAHHFEPHTVTTLASDAVRINFARPITKLEILEREGIVHYIGLGRPPTTSTYDLLHPGNGELAKRVPPQVTVYLLAASAPTLPVEVLGLAGAYIERGVS